MTQLKRLLDAAQFGDHRQDYASVRHSNNKKRETETLKKRSMFLISSSSEKCSPCPQCLALDLPAFNTQVDKNLFIWILSAKKLPRSKVLNPGRVQLVKMESGDDNVYFCL